MSDRGILKYEIMPFGGADTAITAQNIFLSQSSATKVVRGERGRSCMLTWTQDSWLILKKRKRKKKDGINEMGIRLYPHQQLVFFLHPENVQSESSYFCPTLSSKPFDGTCQATSPCRQKRRWGESFARLTFQEEEGVNKIYLSGVTWSSCCTCRPSNISRRRTLNAGFTRE